MPGKACAARGGTKSDQTWSINGILLASSRRSMPMAAVNIYEAKTRLSQLVDKAASGEDVVLSRNGKPLVRITQLAGTKQPVKFGVLKGKVKVAADFNAPLPPQVLAGFEGP
jgi:prevent-host-death family protein